MKVMINVENANDKELELIENYLLDKRLYLDKDNDTKEVIISKISEDAQYMLTVIKSLSRRAGDKIHEEKLLKMLDGRLETLKPKEAIEELKRHGEIFEPNDGFICMI